MDLELAGKSVLVTGASRGIGKAIAAAFAREGARLSVCARDEGPLRAAVAEWARPEDHLAVAADVTTAAGVERFVAAARARHGRIDVLVNNVGGSGARDFDLATREDFEATFTRNFWPALDLSRAVLPDLRAQGGGAIVHVASIWGREGGGAPAYNVAKAAEISLAKAMARDLAKDRIRVNAVAPGSIWFPGGGWARREQADPDGIRAFVAREIPSGRFGRPEEVADVVVFLCSARAGWVTGACLSVDGGQSRAF